jgi:deoxycytidylate deaminase
MTWANGNCAKRVVVCNIVDPKKLFGGPGLGRELDDWVVGYGNNGCINPQPKCPREPGEGYLKCKTICGQQGHAEDMALQDAARRGIDVKGMEAHVYGHNHVCGDCGDKLVAAGIARVIVHLTR